MFKDELIKEFVDWKNANPQGFNWWNYVNIKADLQTALAFARFFYPDIIEIDGLFLLKDKFSQKNYESWRNECKGDKKCIEKMMNLYQVDDFFHINTDDDGNIEEQVRVLGNILKTFWSMSFKDRFPDRCIKVMVFEDGGDYFITVFEGS
ncbi:hypothetical protein [Numidum massiliense]|uniref:hypothetical protein n=1 Tax=Numidum massiliense TaxID=1522315 RepID=UPI0006D59D5D|nr:hypothetical protein [Numidum massiliense]